MIKENVTFCKHILNTFKALGVGLDRMVYFTFLFSNTIFKTSENKLLCSKQTALFSLTQLDIKIVR